MQIKKREHDTYESGHLGGYETFFQLNIFQPVLSGRYVLPWYAYNILVISH